MQIWNWKIKAKKSLQIWILESLGLHLERFGVTLGRLLDALGCLLVVFWSLKAKFLQAWVQDGIQDSFWIHLGFILEGFGKVLAGCGKHLGMFGSLNLGIHPNEKGWSNSR